METTVDSKSGLSPTTRDASTSTGGSIGGGGTSAHVPGVGYSDARSRLRTLRRSVPSRYDRGHTTDAAVRVECHGQDLNLRTPTGEHLECSAFSGLGYRGTVVRCHRRVLNRVVFASVRWNPSGSPVASDTRFRTGRGTERIGPRPLVRATVLLESGRLVPVLSYPRSTSDSPVIADGVSTFSSSSIVGATSRSDPPSRTRFPPASPSGVR